MNLANTTSCLSLKHTHIVLKSLQNKMMIVKDNSCPTENMPIQTQVFKGNYVIMFQT